MACFIRIHSVFLSSSTLTSKYGHLYLKKQKKNKMVSAKKVEKKDSTPIRDITVAMSTSYI